MKVLLLPLAASLLFVAACSGDDEAKVEAPAQSAESAMAGKAPPAPRQAPAQAEMAAFEAGSKQSPVDPCDLHGYDMSKMTADQHEELVKLCQKSKQQ